MPITPEQHSILRAFTAYTEAEGKDEAHELLIEIGDALGLWPAEEPLPAEDMSKLAATLLVKGMTTVACRQRRDFLAEIAKQAEAGVRLIDGERRDAA